MGNSSAADKIKGETSKNLGSNSSGKPDRIENKLEGRKEKGKEQE